MRVANICVCQAPFGIIESDTTSQALLSTHSTDQVTEGQQGE